MLKLLFQIGLFVALVLPSHAQDWVVSRVRGTAEQKVGGQWLPLERGASVLDEQLVRTGPDGHVGLARGAEMIELDPGTELRLHEGEGKFTSVEQSSGVITVDAERRNVQHFSVQTPFLAAVVKGTRFTVSVGDGEAQVTVDRGTVQVQDTLNDLVVDLVSGQEAEVSTTAPLNVAGAGTIAVFTFDGVRVVNGTADVPADDRGLPETPGDSATQPVPANPGTAGAIGNDNAARVGDSDDNRSGNSGNDNGRGEGSGTGNGGDGHSGGNGNDGDSHNRGDASGNSGNGNNGSSNSDGSNTGSGNSEDSNTSSSGNSGSSNNDAGNSSSGNSAGNSSGGNESNGNSGGNDRDRHDHDHDHGRGHR